MPQMVSGAADPIAPDDVVTVAELLHRYAPDPTGGPLTVDSLLRREGRAPSPDARAPRERDAAGTDGPRRGSGAFVRRSAIAAGTLLAAGSVLGAAVLGDAGVTGAADGAGTPGGHPGEGRLDLPSGGDRPIPTVVDNTAQSDPLDAGDAAPSTWTDVAFPAGATAASTAPAPVGGSSAPAAPEPARASTGTGTTGGSTAGRSDTGPDDAVEQNSGLGGAVQDVGAAAGGPVGGVVEDLGGAVSGVGDTLGGGGPSVLGDLARGLL